ASPLIEAVPALAEADEALAVVGRPPQAQRRAPGLPRLQRQSHDARADDVGVGEDEADRGAARAFEHRPGELRRPGDLEAELLHPHLVEQIARQAHPFATRTDVYPWYRHRPHPRRTDLSARGGTVNRIVPRSETTSNVSGDSSRRTATTDATGNPTRTRAVTVSAPGFRTRTITPRPSSAGLSADSTSVDGSSARSVRPGGSRGAEPPMTPRRRSSPSRADPGSGPTERPISARSVPGPCAPGASIGGPAGIGGVRTS